MVYGCIYMPEKGSDRLGKAKIGEFEKKKNEKRIRVFLIEWLDLIMTVELMLA